MKLKDLGFRRKTQQLFSKGKSRKPGSTESPLLQEHNLPENSQCPPWLKGWHDFENMITEGWINARKSSGITVV